MLAAAALLALTMGTRSSFGLFLSPMNTDTAAGLAVLGLAVALGQLGWDVAQPVAGWLASRHGVHRVVRAGAVLGAAATASMALSDQALEIVLLMAALCLLAAGFFVCGFHVSFLTTHMPGVIESCGLPTALAGTWLAIIGLCNIAGSIASGMLSQRLDMARMLMALYAPRARHRAVPVGAEDRGGDARLRRLDGPELHGDLAAHGGPDRPPVRHAADGRAARRHHVRAPDRGPSWVPGWAVWQWPAAATTTPCGSPT